MGVDTKAIIIVGKNFRNEKLATEYFQSKVEMTEEDLDEMGPHLEYWLESREKNGFPTCGFYNHYSRDGEFYIGYKVFDKNPAIMMKNIEEATNKWLSLFNEMPEVIQEVIYW